MWELLGPMSMPNYFLEASSVHPRCIPGASLVDPRCIPAPVDLVPGPCWDTKNRCGFSLKLTRASPLPSRIPPRTTNSALQALFVCIF